MKKLTKLVSLFLTVILTVSCFAGATVFNASAAEGVTVTSTSNFFPTKSQSFTAAQLAENDNLVTVSYFIKSDKDLLDTQWTLTYDGNVLKYDRENNTYYDGRKTVLNVMPIADDAVVNNDLQSVEYGLKGNCTSLALYFLSTEDGGQVAFVTVTFEVIGSGETTVDLQVEELTASVLREGEERAKEEDDEALISEGEVLSVGFDYTLVSAVYPGTYNADYVSYDGVEYNGMSLLLQGNIGLKLYYIVPAEYASLEDAPLYLEYTNRKGTSTVSPVAGDYENEYAFVIRVDAPDMSDVITVNLHIGDTVVDTRETSVTDYCTKALSAYKDEKTKYLVYTLLDYGAKAQTYFGRNLDNPANAMLDGLYEMETINADDITNTIVREDSTYADFGLQYNGSTIITDSQTTICHYFIVTDEEKYAASTFTLGGKEVSAKDMGSEICFEITNISSDKLDVPYSIEMSNGDSQSEITYSVMDFARRVLQTSSDQNYKNMVNALYWYNDAAKKYFA